MYDVAIIGGGFAGIYSAWRCAHAGLKVLLVEKDDHLGGALHSVEKLGYLVDIGAHHLDLRAPRDAEFYGDILGGSLKIIENHGWASTTGGAFTFGLEVPDFSTSDTDLCAKALSELAQIRESEVQPEGLQDWLSWKFGTTLSTHLGAIVAKVTGAPASALDRAAASGLGMLSRVKLGSDSEMVALKGQSEILNDRLAVSLACRDIRFLGKNNTFRFGYPASGSLRAFCTSAAERLTELKVEIRLGESILDISSRPESVSLTLSDSKATARSVLWTLPENGLLKLLRLDSEVSMASQPVGAVIHVFEVGVDDILGPSYVHDFSPDRVSFRYSRPGTYSGQIRPDGRTFVLAEIPCHPAHVDHSTGLQNHAWRDLVASGYLRGDAQCLGHASLQYPVAYALPRPGWQPIVDRAKTLISESVPRILSIPFKQRGRDSFMTYFDDQLMPVLMDRNASLGRTT
ncbi:MAG: NAD(P)-binding protein [Tabrizicola sp.]|nr:NAD(P)-binding protein [Tabrizicola sp.]